MHENYLQPTKIIIDNGQRTRKRIHTRTHTHTNCRTIAYFDGVVFSLLKKATKIIIVIIIIEQKQQNMRMCKSYFDQSVALYPRTGRNFDKWPLHVCPNTFCMYSIRNQIPAYRFHM